MRGFPLLQAGAIFLVVLTLGWPLRDLTLARKPPAVLAAGGETRATVPVQLTFTAPPAQTQIRHLGELVWEGAAAEAAAPLELSLPFPPEGVELEFRVGWDPGVEAALRVQLTDPGGERIERLLWGRGPTTATLAFP